MPATIDKFPFHVQTADGRVRPVYAPTAEDAIRATLARNEQEYDTHAPVVAVWRADVKWGP